MGIRDLWGTLAPFCERKSLYTLEGQVIAIDLAGWVVEAQTVDNTMQRNHLRNVFYRTTQLLSMNVYPVFVLEGKAPKLKYKTIAERNLLQNKGAKPKTNAKPNQGRTRFHHVLKQCEEMLKFMGLTCITGKGEAEATCAYLNSKGLVSGVISQDSDCFAYGARIVYRNYSKTDNKIDVYDMVKAEKALSFGRNKIIVVALFCGSDYDNGINGVGRDAVINFMKHFKDYEIIDRIKSWRHNTEYYDEWDKKIRDKRDKTFDENYRLRMKNELQIRNKALQQNSKFPNEELINEFLDLKDDIEELDLTWRQPNLISLLKFTSKLLGWKEIYTFQKVLPLITFWQLKNHIILAEKIASNNLLDLKGVIFPKYIRDKKTLKGILSYEVVWEDKHKYFDGLIPEEQIDCDIDCLWSTVEKATLLEEAHPIFVFNFEEQTRAKKLEKQKNRRQKNQNTRAPKKSRKMDINTNALILNDGLKTIDSFFPKTKVNKLINEKQQQPHVMHDFSFDLNCSGFTDNDEENISLVVDKIVSKPPKLVESVNKLGFKCSMSPGLHKQELNCNDLILEGIHSGDETIDYLSDSLDLDKPYVPLFERLKKKC